MKLRRPDRLGFGCGSHRSAVWWLGLVYRRPDRFAKCISRLSRPEAALASAILTYHAIPWLVLWIGASNTISIACGVSSIPTTFGHAPHLFVYLTTYALMLAMVVISGVVMALLHHLVLRERAGDAILHGIAFILGVGLVIGVFPHKPVRPLNATDGATLAFCSGLLIGFFFSIRMGGVSVVARVIILLIASSLASSYLLVTYGLDFGLAFLGVQSVVILVVTLRLYYYPIHILLTWPIARCRYFAYHPVGWDDQCTVPFLNLDRLLVSYAEMYPVAGSRQIARLIRTCPSQRMAALRAETTLIARTTARTYRLGELASLAAVLPEGDRGFLSQTRAVREMIAEIVQLQIRIEATDRPIFREPLARALQAEIDAFRGRVAGFREPLATEFGAAAGKWREIAEWQWREARTILSKTPTAQVFRAGDPVDRSHEAFVERSSVVGELEGQIMLGTGCPGILLYGRRRMGKSTVLRNLGAFLPRRVLVAVESLQNPQAFQSVEAFVGQIIWRVRETLRQLGSPAVTPTDLAGFFNWLSEVDRRLANDDRRLLLALDEYEQIDEQIGRGVFTDDLLKTLRESVQSHRRITWVLSGSHDVTELRHAPWPSYLVSVRTIEVPPFRPEETRLLLTEPMKHSPLWMADDPGRPRFDPAFWGGGGIERIHAETAGWPHLVQLLAETAVDLVNQSTATRLEPARMDEVLDRAVVRGDNVLRLLMQTESELPGEWEYLLAFRHCELQPLPTDERLYTSLRRRLLVYEESGQWRLRVPLMERWLRQRG